MIVSCDPLKHFTVIQVQYIQALTRHTIRCTSISIAAHIDLIVHGLTEDFMCCVNCVFHTNHICQKEFAVYVIGFYTPFT